LNEAGQLVGIHVGLTKVGGDGEGVLISTFLQMVPPEVEEVLGRSTPDVLSSSSSENEGVELQLPSKEEKVSMEDENGIGVELPEQLDKERRKREEIEQRVQELEVERNKEEERRTKQEQLQRQLEKEKRQRQKAEWREERLEAERQREQCKQRRSQKENQKKSELGQKRIQAFMAWRRRVLVYFIFGMCFAFVFAARSLFIWREKFLPLIMERWKKSKEEVESFFASLIVALIALVVVLFIGDFIRLVFINIFGDFSQAAYHMWINCYDAYPPTPPRLF
jgi:cation transport ATPase